jgi:hypothetical protein
MHPIDSQMNVALRLALATALIGSNRLRRGGGGGKLVAEPITTRLLALQQQLLRAAVGLLSEEGRFCSARTSWGLGV